MQKATKGEAVALDVAEVEVEDRDQQQPQWRESTISPMPSTRFRIHHDPSRSGTILLDASGHNDSALA